MWRERIPKHWLWALAGVATVVLVLFVLWGGPWLFTLHPHHGLTAEQELQELKAKNDVRTTLVQAVAGLAVAGGLIFTYRNFRQNQMDQAKRWEEQDRTYRLNQSQQVTETYAKAVEQLGHDEAPVRLGAMYSLERLAQDNPPRRQTTVDVLCAYLRMPYTPPPRNESAADPENEAPTGATEPAAASVPRHDPAQELQVRQTAQHLLATHLRRPPDISGEDAQHLKGSPEQTFWPRISLDLTGATLVDLDLKGLSVIDASFARATFSGDAGFDEATFSDAWFEEATFSGARFDEATFSGTAVFVGATFSRDAGFGGAHVLHLDDPYLNRGGEDAPWVWPKGWTVRPDADDPSWGTLVSSAAGDH